MLETFLLLSAAAGAMSLTLTTTKAGKPLRTFLGWLLTAPVQHITTNRLARIASNYTASVDQLLRCPYCMVHWIAGWLVLQYNMQVFGDSSILNWFLSSMSMVAVSTVGMVLITGRRDHD